MPQTSAKDLHFSHLDRSICIIRRDLLSGLNSIIEYLTMRKLHDDRIESNVKCAQTCK